VAGEYAASKGFPIMDENQDIRLGPVQINEALDAIALKLSSAWPNAVNTTSGIATTGNINANGSVITNGVTCNVNAFVGGQLSVTGGINTNGTVRANTVVIGSGSSEMNVRAEIDGLKARLAAAGN